MAEKSAAALPPRLLRAIPDTVETDLPLGISSADPFTFICFAASSCPEDKSLGNPLGKFLLEKNYLRDFSQVKRMLLRSIVRLKGLRFDALGGGFRNGQRKVQAVRAMSSDSRALMLGATAGSLLRYSQSLVLSPEFLAYPSVAIPFWTSTLLVNIVGSAALTTFSTLESSTSSVRLPSFLTRPMFAVGFCGSYTKFSAFELESLQLFSQEINRIVGLASYACASLILSVGSSFSTHFLLQKAGPKAQQGAAGLLLLSPFLILILSAIVFTDKKKFSNALSSGVTDWKGARSFLVIAVGGFAGAFLRDFASNMQGLRRLSPTLPSVAPTFFVNIIGSFLIGMISTSLSHKPSSDPTRLLLVTGFLGGFTTFSTFSHQLLTLSRLNHHIYALCYVLLSLCSGFLAAFAGRSVCSRQMVLHATRR